MGVREKLSQTRVEIIALVIEGVIPETGQLPFIILSRVRATFSDWEIDFADMQLAFNYLRGQGRIFPEQDVSRSVRSRVYRVRDSFLPVHY